MDDKRYAVLIDSDNISSKYISDILDEMTKYGVITYKRIYGDWTSTQASKWKKELMENSITPDGDFTRLASRLRESGMDVIGMGESKTPRSFRAACSVFTDLELLREQAHEDEPDSKPVKKTERSNIIKQSKIENAIIEIIQENDNKGRQTGLGELGSRLQKKYSDFDVRNYGYSSLSTFLEEMESLELKKFNNTVLVRLKEDKNMKEQVMEYAVNYVKSSENAVELGALGQKIHMNYPNFKVKEYGYSTLSKFIAGIKCLKITATDENRRMVSIK